MTAPKDEPKKHWNVADALQLALSVCAMIAGVALGAVIGWHYHGLVGAIGLGFAGLVAGGIASSPSLFLQILS